MQEELESVFLADQAKQKQLEELKQQVSASVAELEKERKEKLPDRTCEGSGGRAGWSEGRA